MITNILTNITLTAYCSCTAICCPATSKGLTANGTRPIQGITVAAPRRLPFNSDVIFNGRTYKVQDRLAKRYDSRFDIYFAKHSDAKKFGIKTNQTVVVVFNTK